jgi:hypothetical protein
MYKTSLGSVTAEIEELLVEKLSAKGRDLNQKVKSAGRKLPRSVRLHVAYLIEAEARTKNPKFAHQYDADRVVEAWKHCVSYLEKIDRNAIRSYHRLGWFTTVLVNLFLLTGLFAVVVYLLG